MNENSGQWKPDRKNCAHLWPVGNHRPGAKRFVGSFRLMVVHNKTSLHQSPVCRTWLDLRRQKSIPEKGEEFVVSVWRDQDLVVCVDDQNFMGVLPLSHINRPHNVLFADYLNCTWTAQDAWMACGEKSFNTLWTIWGSSLQSLLPSSN